MTGAGPLAGDPSPSTVDGPNHLCPSLDPRAFGIMLTGELQAVKPLDSKQDLDECWGVGAWGQVSQAVGGGK